MKKDITEEFCMIDDFVKEYKKVIKSLQIQDKDHTIKNKTRTPGVTESEIISEVCPAYFVDLLCCLSHSHFL